MKPGFAFPDSLRVGKRPSRFSRRTFSEGGSVRGMLLPILSVVVFGFVFVRLFHLQLVEGSYYRGLSNSNRVRTTIVHAPRGIIFDRNGIPLVFNSPGFRLLDGEKTKQVSREKAISLLAKGVDTLEVDVLRSYPYREALAHVIGYVGEITKEELQEGSFEAYRLGDRVGRTGMEEAYERLLRGTDGKELIEVDSRGKKVRTLGKVDPIAGNGITVTLDAGVAQAAYEAFSLLRGAVVASTPNGEILVLFAKPAFDPNLFTLDDSYQAATSASYRSVSEVLSDRENQPFLNRAIAGVYPPGSTFKLITAAAGLEGSIIDERFEVADTGVISVGAFSFSNWYFTQYGKTDGALNVVKAIKRSNDIFFYKLAEVIGVDRLSEMAKRFGLGEQLGIDIPGEAKGIVPTEEWKKEAIGEPWYLGDTYHYGIGQGYVLTTPLQVNAWTQVIANSGTLYQQRLLKNTTNTTNTTNKPIRKNFLSQKTVELIREGMIESCSPGGVAWPLFEFKVENRKLKVDGKNFLEVPQATVSAAFKDYRQVSIACKTGTAQQGGEKDLPHAWITLFAPAYDPQIVLTVLVEASGEGSNIAAPIAKKILEAWFSPHK